MKISRLTNIISLLILSMFLSIQLQAIEEDNELLKSFKTLQIFNQFNEKLLKIIDNMEIEAQLDELCYQLKEKVELTDQGKQAAKSLQNWPANQVTENYLASLYKIHRNYTEEIKDFFEQLKNYTKGTFLLTLSNAPSKQDSSCSPKADKALDDLWECSRVLPIYRELYLCDESNVASIVQENHEILGLKIDEISSFISELTPRVRRNNFVKIFHIFTSNMEDVVDII